MISLVCSGFCDGGGDGGGGLWREWRLTGLGKWHRKCLLEIYGHEFKWGFGIFSRTIQPHSICRAGFNYSCNFVKWVTKWKRGKKVEVLWKGEMIISCTTEGGRTEGHQWVKDKCRDGRIIGLKDLVGSKDYMVRVLEGVRKKKVMVHGWSRWIEVMEGWQLLGMMSRLKTGSWKWLRQGRERDG